MSISFHQVLGVLVPDNLAVCLERCHVFTILSDKSRSIELSQSCDSGNLRNFSNLSSLVTFVISVFPEGLTKELPVSEGILTAGLYLWHGIDTLPVGVTVYRYQSWVSLWSFGVMGTVWRFGYQIQGITNLALQTWYQSPRVNSILIMPSKRASEGGNGNQSAPQPVQPDPLDEHISHAEFRTAFTTLASSVAAYNERPTVVPANPVENSAAVRIRDFTRINPPLFTDSKSEEDSQEFLDQVDRGTDTEPIEWEEFATTFLDRFFPIEAKVLEFINLRQGTMSIKEYSPKFSQLARYAPHVVADSRSRMSKFVSGVSHRVVKECRTAMLIGDIDISRLMIYAQQMEEQKLKKKERENKRARTNSYSFAQHRSQGQRLPQSGYQSHLRSSFQSGSPNQQSANSSAISGQRPNRLYALRSRQNQENPPDVVTVKPWGQKVKPSNSSYSSNKSRSIELSQSCDSGNLRNLSHLSISVTSVISVVLEGLMEELPVSEGILTAGLYPWHGIATLPAGVIGWTPPVQFRGILPHLHTGAFKVLTQLRYGVLYHRFRSTSSKEPLGTSIEPYGLSVHVFAFAILLLLFTDQFTDISHELACGPSGSWVPCIIPENPQVEMGVPVKLCGSFEKQAISLYMHANNHQFFVLLESIFQRVLESILHKLEHKSLALEKLIALAMDIARGMEYIHSHDIIHWDLKPKNILINEDFHLKLIDFRIACEEAYCDLLVDDLGPYRWMAPEIIKRKNHTPEKLTYMDLNPFYGKWWVEPFLMKI
ncbi:hypothetical protein FXO37_18261 [Capsicum annuum]|nr:hypothetical protein FXO37_18261 [Capsicum annuum]